MSCWCNELHAPRRIRQRPHGGRHGEATDGARSIRVAVNNVRQTLIQIVTPDHMRGRVSAVSGLFISGSNELGEFESGVLSRFIGPVMAAAFGGIGTMVVTGAWAWMFPALRRADKLDGTPHG